MNHARKRQGTSALPGQGKRSYAAEQTAARRRRIEHVDELGQRLARRLERQDAGKPGRGRRSSDRSAHWRFHQKVLERRVSNIVKADLGAEQFRYEIDEAAWAAVAYQPREVAGLLEVDETYFPYSEKGGAASGARRRSAAAAKGKGPGAGGGDWVPVLVGRGRGLPATADRVLEAMNGEAVADSLRKVVAPGETVVCTDGHSAFLRLHDALGVATKSFVASHHGHVLDRAYHVQTANQYHGTLKGWIQVALRGVATKYLPHYLAWMRLMSWDGRGVSPREIVASALGRQVINL